MSRPHYSRRRYQPRFTVRVNNRIRAREVRVVDSEGQQLGVMSTAAAISKARAQGVDLVEVAANASPPVCRLVDYGKYRYEQSKKEKEAKKSQHANKVKEIQLRPGTDTHDMKMKADHAIEFLCEDMKVKVTLRYRGRENAHKEIGFGVMQKFIEGLKDFGTADAPIKSIGRSINVMLSPLPRERRAPNPNAHLDKSEREEKLKIQEGENEVEEDHESEEPKAESDRVPTDGSSSEEGFSNSPFDKLEKKD